MEELQTDNPTVQEEEKKVEEKPKEVETDVQTTRKSKEEKGRKKDDRSVEQVLKALSSLATSEEKLAAMCKKYADIVDENRKLQVQVKQFDKKVIVLQREKEQIQVEQSKTVLTRSRLESLCRELQKQNKQIKEESLQRIKEEEEKRKAVSGKFQSTLGEITALMQQNNENNSKLRDENVEMRNKFKTLCEQYELREQQVDKLSKQMQLESHLAEAKLTKIKIEMGAEKELLENEKKQLLIELAAYQQKCQELQKNEATLKSQITMYTEKYDKFQDALAKSNQLYNGFKSEMEKMSKKIAKLEKETSVWKIRWENNHKALLQVTAEKQQKVSELSLATRQLTQLQKLCRTLQADRTSLLTQLKNEGIPPQLSGERNSATPENECDSRPEDKPEPESCPEVLENGSGEPDDRETSPLPEKDELEVKDTEKAEEEAEDPSSTDLDAGKGDEISKSESNSKTKKGKEGSKRRKK